MIKGDTFTTSTKITNFVPSPTQLPIRKNEQQIYYLKTIESANTGLITRPPSIWTS